MIDTHCHLYDKRLYPDLTQIVKNAEKFANQVLSFPHHQYLKENQIEYICNHINKFYNNV